MQIKVTRKSVAGAVTIVITLMTLSVMYHGIVTGIGVIPGFSFLLWTLIALAYATHEEITDYIEENHSKVTVPLRVGFTEIKTSIAKITGRHTPPEGILNQRGIGVRDRLRQSLIHLLQDIIQTLENPDDKPRGNP
ncbi:hypothetical protein JXL21_08750 [Candidatus Bathyarchaeota archaeon]|nr:hypothetical protein [Candidatus Bathyarchaeota archaeon]